MSRELWKIGVPWRERRPEGTVRHSQITAGYGPGALVDFVEDAAIIAGLSWWARGPEIVEDRLIAMLARQEGFQGLKLFAPPAADSRDLENPLRKWIKAFRFPQWSVCQNERCWDDSGQPERRDGARPTRLLHVTQLDGAGHRCKGGKGRPSKVQPIRFTRACRMGHIDDIDWPGLLHRKERDCKRRVLWLDEAGESLDLQDIRISCSGCGANLRMSAVAQPFTDDAPTLGSCTGARPWIGHAGAQECREPMMRFLLRSATHAYFGVPASVIHIPDPDASLRDRVTSVFDALKKVKSPGQIETLRELLDPVRVALEELSNEVVFAEIQRRGEGKPVAYRKVKDAEIEVLAKLPAELSTDRPGGRFFGRTAPTGTSTGPMASIERVVLLHRLTEVRALAGFTRFEPRSVDVDGELDLGAEVAKIDDPLTWLPAIENHGEGVFFSLKGDELQKWEGSPGVIARKELFERGFATWREQRDDRRKAKPDFVAPRFVLLHSLSHLLITAVSLECGYSASSIRERIYVSPGGCGVLLYTASPGAEGSLGGLVEVGRRLDRYLERALDLARLCSNDPVCAAHEPAADVGGSDRHLEGASCHGCLLISEPSCERMNLYLDRTLVVPTVESGDAAFFGGSWRERAR